MSSPGVISQVAEVALDEPPEEFDGVELRLLWEAEEEEKGVALAEAQEFCSAVGRRVVDEEDNRSAVLGILREPLYELGDEREEGLPPKPQTKNCSARSPDASFAPSKRIRSYAIRVRRSSDFPL